MPVLPEIEQLGPVMRQWRHHLHANPETAFEEVKTAAFVATKLQEFGAEVHQGIAGTGVVGVIAGQGDGPWLGLRADMDALHIEEANDFAHRSLSAGKMHACGHDGHTAMLLGAARHLAETRDFNGTVAVIFQPAEENEGGGRVMVEDGLFERFPIASVYGMHNWPGLEVGSFAIRTGPMMAAYDIFEIALDGQGAHAGMPHLGRDPMVAAAHLVIALQTIAARNVDPLEAAVVSVTQIHGGDTWNVLPQQVVLRGTVRTFLPEIQDLVQRRIGEIAEGVAGTFGIEARLRYERRYPSTINAPDPALIAAGAATAVVGPDRVDPESRPSMGSEDFAFLLQACPGAYIRIGAGPGRTGCMLHNPGYDFNDDILTLGASYWVQLVHMVLAPGN
ncbi:M20 aminoacylase family protein [Telmatospirillum sp.]|uniref:M20 aminoacylase family protein n=1 Tax=Telmatospirillum sp. TaxID=2079197 RepID=UPI00284ED980|nr:M20 aminoacylase family protein [Telmatospirillum sp.]MDR3435421.1 M20 family metallopeptidase [Telmatospirillum sp.]